MSQKSQYLPPGWSEIKLGDCATVITKGTTPTTYGYEYLDHGIRFVRVEHFSEGVINSPSIEKFISQDAHNLLKRSQLREGDVLVSIAGTIGRVAIVRACDTPANTNQAVGIIRGVRHVFYPPFLRSMLASPSIQDAIRNRKRGGGMNNISLEDLQELCIPLPPLPEQARIADTLDELFSDLDAGVAALERVQTKLKHYRAAVLKAAVEGALTAAWRTQHPATEPASALLTRILAERRRRWEDTQLQKFKEAGKTPPKDWKVKYKEPAAAETANWRKLPEQWCWATVEQLAVITSGQTPSGMPTASEPNGKIFWFRVGDMNATGNEKWMVTGGIVLTRETAKRLGLKPLPEGSIIFPKRGGAIATNKKRLLKFAASCDLNLMAVSPSPVIADYLWLFFQHLNLAKLSDGSSVPQINNPDILLLLVPLPPADEQAAIVEAVEDQLSVIDHLEADLAAKLKSAQALRQSILRHAFSGQLVPQDPNDEPASTLLVRIAAEREERTRLAQTAKKRPVGKRGTGQGRT